MKKRILIPKKAVNWQSQCIIYKLSTLWAASKGIFSSNKCFGEIRVHSQNSGKVNRLSIIPIIHRTHNS